MPLFEAAIRKGASSHFFNPGEEEIRLDRYLHWDEFRHRYGPKGDLSVEEQWAALRMRRASRSQPVSLTDSRGRHFTFFLTQRAFEELHEIDLHCGGGMATPREGIIDRENRDRYYINSLLEEALTSSQLEGAVVTRSEAREMIREGRTPSSKHEKMVMNNFKTMAMISKLRDRDLSAELILEIHREITAGTLDDPRDEGRLRTPTDQVRVEDEESGEVFHVPPPAEELPERLKRLCEFSNEKGMAGFLHPVIRSILLHFWIAYDHPFVDGNGRTARALFYWSMLRHGYWLAEFFSISHEILKAPKQYYRAFLHTETDGNDLNYFIHHQLNTIRGAIEALREYIGRKQEELARLKRHLGPGSGFNHRQLALLRHALMNPYASYTVASHQTSHGISTQTATTDLNFLVADGLLTKAKAGKAFLFSPSADLSQRLGFQP
jgi:Fic family protein